jgi:choline dehydrogenase-like flavoprotein
MYDFAIIGSGVSGARIAYHLTQGGARCVMLEAGRAFDRHTFPRGEMGYSTQMFWGGGVEVSRDGRFGFLRGKCLGGTSVVNQADLDPFDDLVWDDWRQRTDMDLFSANRIAPLYAEIDRTVTSGPIPTPYYNRNAKLFASAFDHHGFHWQPIRRAQTDCALEHGSDCIVCLGGCPRDAKQSALVHLIPSAVAHGLTIETEFEVQRLDLLPDGVRVCGRQRQQEQSVIAAQAVLAAGSFGNTALLGRSPDIAQRLPALGSHFCCHPQFMTFGLFDEPVDAHKGPLQSVQAHDDNLRRAGLKFENVFAPPIATAMLIPAYGRTHHAVMKRYRHLASIEVAVRDEPLGKIRLDSRHKLRVEKPLSDLDRSRITDGQRIIRELFASVGAKQIIQGKQGFGLHLMGGCPIGSDPRQSVVGPDFRLHGFPRLWAADSSIFPAAPGINPSYTIMALSYHATSHMLAK